MKLLIALLFLCSCGYHFEGDPDGLTAICIPYIQGDSEGRLNTELVRALVASGIYQYMQGGGDLILEAAIIADSDDRIGFRFDRDPTTGKLRDNIVGTENRRMLSVQVTLLDGRTRETILGPQVISAHADYDYVDSNSIRDLVFRTKEGKPQKILDFSLGQLDSVDGAHDDTSIVIYRLLAQKIVDGLILRRPTVSSQ